MTDMASAAAGHDDVVASGKGPRAGQPKRRTFTAAYKTRILQEYDQLQTGRERGALLRREGLYSSHIDGWRKTREAGAVNGLADKPAGRPGRSTEAVENERLRKENENALAQSQLVVEQREREYKEKVVGFHSFMRAFKVPTLADLAFGC